MLESRPILLLCLLLLACTMAAGQVPVVNGDGMTFDDLIREKTFVTIVLKDPPARHVNARITGVSELAIGVLGDDNVRGAYLLSGIREVRVQDGRVPTRRSRATDRAFNEDELIIINRAGVRALEIFEASKGDQGIRMEAALVLAASSHEYRSSALGYLQELAAGNDVPTAMAATTFSYLAGIPPNPEIIQAGFRSGNRQARASAARLTGLTKNVTFLPEVQEMLRDSMIEIFPPAAKAIGRMDERSGLPELYEAMHALREPKGEAAVFALSRMGDEEVLEKMLEMLDESKGIEWFRVLRVLYALDDDRAKVLMKEEALPQPAYQRMAALLLAADEVWEGTVFLRDYLEKNEDQNLLNSVFKAKVAETLYTTGDIQAKNLLQELVNIKSGMIYAKGHTDDKEFKARIATEIQLNVVALIGDTGSRGLLSLLVGPVESANPRVAIAACRAVMAIGNPEFGARLKEIRL